MFFDNWGNELHREYTGPTPLIKETDTYRLIDLAREQGFDYIEPFHFPKNSGIVGVRPLFREDGYLYGFGLYCRYQTNKGWVEESLN